MKIKPPGVAAAMFTRQKAFLAASAMLAAVFSPVATQATSLLPDASYVSSAFIGTLTGSYGPGQVLTAVPSLSASTADTSVKVTNNYAVPSLSAYANGALNTPGFVEEEGDASSHLEYFIRFVGAPGLIQARVQASGTALASSSATSLALAQSSIFITDAGPSISAGACMNISNCSNVSSFSVDGYYAFDANASYDVQMGVATIEEVDSIACHILGTECLGTASASVDPMFTPPPGYTLDISPNIGNSIGSAPEPSTWAMMLLGFAGLGFMGYRRARTNSTQLAAA